MNYQRIHDQIIVRARARVRPAEYCEHHHVVPKSMGGTDSKSNIALLTAREHYLIHWLLFKIHRNREMAFAWFYMCGKGVVGKRYTSHTFMYAKKAKAEFQSKFFAGKRLSEEHRQKLSAAKKGRTYADLGRHGDSPLKGRPLTEQHKQKVSLSGKGRKHSPEVRARLSQSKTGAWNPQFGKSPSLEVRAKLSAAIKAYRRRLKELKAQREKVE